MNAPAKIKIVKMLEAKTNLSRLVHEVETGESEVIISRNGKPVARLVPHVEEAKPDRSKRIGILKGKFTWDSDLSDSLDAEIAEEMLSGPIFPDDA